MKAYHYTGMKGFSCILRDEVILSRYARLAKEIVERRGGTFEDQFRKVQDIFSNDDPKEKRNDRSVYLSHRPDRTSLEGAVTKAMKNQELVVLEFDFPANMNLETPNCGYVRVSPELSLEYLTEVYAQRHVLDKVQGKLKLAHNGKYADIPVYEWESAKIKR